MRYDKDLRRPIHASVALAILAAGCPRRPTREIDPPAAAGAMAPNLAATAGGWLMTWVEPGSGGHRVRFARFAAGAWNAPSTIAEGAAIVANWADVPSVAAAANGALVAHWAEASTDEAYDVVLARSEDGGASWRRLGVPHRDGTRTEHGFVSLVGEGAAVRAVWLDGRAGTTALRSALVGVSIGEEEVIDARVCDCCGTAAIATEGGTLVAYRDRSGDELRDIATARRASEGWSEPSAVHGDGWKIAGCPVNGPAAAVDAGRVAVAWFTLAGDRPSVRVAFSSDGGVTFAAPIDVDARAPLGRVDVVVHGGEAIVSWMASAGEDAVLLARRVDSDGRMGETLSIAPMRPDRASGFPRMELAGDQLGFVWTDTDARLRAARLAVADLPAPRQGEGPASSSGAGPRVGSPMPAFAAVTLSGEPVTLGAGQVSLVNVWATWCEPCRQELPVLVELHRRHAGLHVVGVSVDRARSSQELVDFVARRKIPFEIWHDRDDRISRLLGIQALPVTLLVDRNGLVVWRKDGAVSDGDPELERAIRAAIERR